MFKTFEFEYVIRDVIPPRCRKPRDVWDNKASVTVEVREVPAELFPVAIREISGLHGVTEYHWFDDSLWLPYKPNWSGDGWRKYAKDESDHFRQWGSPTFPHYATLAEQEQHAHEWAKRHVIVDDLVYATASEPLYVVMTFGMGHNHGGTALMIDHWYNSNIRKSQYFRIDDLDRALELATRTAERRGDTNALPIHPHSTFEILIPDAVRRQPEIEGGDGDPFLNKLYALTEASPDATTAGFAALALLAKELS